MNSDFIMTSYQANYLWNFIENIIQKYDLVDDIKDAEDLPNAITVNFVKNKFAMFVVVLPLFASLQIFKQESYTALRIDCKSGNTIFELRDKTFRENYRRKIINYGDMSEEILDEMEKWIDFFLL